MSNVLSDTAQINILQLDGVEIPYQFISPKNCIDDDTVVVFLHDALGSIAQWKSFPKEICEALQLTGLVYEREGYGNASPLKGKREIGYLEDYALKELPLVIEKLIPTKNVILFGHSDGGSIALIFAAEFPDKVKAIITEAAHVFVESITVNGIKAALNIYEKNNQLKEGLSKYHKEKTDSIFYAWANTWLTKDFFKWNIEYFLHKIKSPSLIIQGNQDEYGSPKQVNNIVRKTSAKSIPLMIDNCGHFPHKDQKKMVVQSAKKFIVDEVFKDQ